MAENQPKKPIERNESERETLLTENLLDDFGASRSKKTTPPTPSPAKKTEPPKAKAEEAVTVTTAKKEATPQTAKVQEKREKNEPAHKETKPLPDAKKKEEKPSQKKNPPPSESVHASTASGTEEQPKKGNAKPAAPKATPKKETRQKTEELPARSSKPAHRVLPYVFALLATLIGICLILNLFCNAKNCLVETPAEHWMGVLGYYVCYVLFGLFGPAAFLIPLLLVNLAVFWKKYLDSRLTILKLLNSLIALVMLGTLIHSFCLITIPVESRALSALELMEHGARMEGGGLISGSVSYFGVQYLNIFGTIVFSLCLLVASVFFLIGITPYRLWKTLQQKKAEKKQAPQSPDEVEAEAARNNAAMKEKINRLTRRQLNADMDAPEGAVKVIETAHAKKEPQEDLAPMPMPKLDPHNGTRPYIAADVNRQMRMEEQKAQQKATAKAPAPAPTTQKSTATVTEEAKRAPAPTPAPMAKPAAPSQTSPVPSPAKNADSAVDPIFPKTNDPRTARKMPKEDRNFDLKSVFIDLDDGDAQENARKHAPVPPEVPLTPAQAAQHRPAAAPTTMQKPLKEGQASSVATPAPSVRTPAQPAAPLKPPSLSTVKPATKADAQKPIFRQADTEKNKKFGLSDEEFEQLEGTNVDLSKKPTVKPKATPAITAAEKPVEQKKYVFPPVSYLHPGEPMTAENRAEIQESMNQLAETLASFRVNVKEINYSCGPTVTRYEVILAAGVRVRTITNLASDIALALRSSGGVRIEAPIPGTNAVGIEVPNKTRSTIYLRDLIESRAFTESKSKLSACLGADIAGEPLIFDIAKMPHLLVAGTTGSGKSVCINCIIMSLLFKARPDEVKLVLIDPKKVEFSIYKNIPHLMAPVVTLPKDAAGALQAAVEEMERRFELFESVGVRDLKGYNEATANDPDMPQFPHMVIIIDELADLMMTAKNEVETAICRIAQKARAAGMHLIIGTQRPSVDVVTGLIKSNVPSCIAFAVKSQVDSRVILDHIGAEALTGRGDMLFVPIGAMRDTRVQGAFVDDKEVEKICEFIRATNGTAQYDEKFTTKLKELAAQCGNKGKGEDLAPLPEGDGGKVDDPKYAEAVRVAVEEKRISTSLLQRKLEVGYSRAAKLIDRMQAEGIVSPPDGSKARSILITPEQYIERFMDGENQ